MPEKFNKMCAQSEIDDLVGRLQTLSDDSPPKLLDSFTADDMGDDEFWVELTIVQLDGPSDDYPVSHWSLSEDWSPAQ
jgi:hypothetical protein